MTTKRDLIIGSMWKVLVRPATLVREITERIVIHLPDEEINYPMISNAIAWLRPRAHEYGWDLMHVKRGNPKEGIDEGRWYRIRVDRDGRPYFFDESPECRRHMLNGAIGTFKQTITMNKNQVTMTNLLLTYTRSPRLRAMIRERMIDQTYATHKFEQILEAVLNE
jgi:hypothetical protein